MIRWNQTKINYDGWSSSDEQAQQDIDEQAAQAHEADRA